MNPVFVRTIISLAVTAAAGAVVWTLAAAYDEQLLRGDWLTGITLAVACGILMLLPLRRRLVLVDLGRVAVWQVFHQYGGVFCLVVFLIHAGFVVDGVLEIALCVSFWIITLSGLGHWYANKVIPRRLAAAGRPIRLLAASQERSQIARDAYQIALDSAVRPGSIALTHCYQKHMGEFLAAKRTWLYHLRPSGVEKRQLVDLIEQTCQYLDDSGRQAADALRRCVLRRDDIDFQIVMLWRLRIWNTIHTSLTVAFVILVSFHVVSVLRTG